jgi:hypothetical protein
MTPKQKAEELVKKYLLKIKIDSRIIGESEVIISKGEIRIETAKHCALIAVNLHLEELSKMKLIFSDREIHYKYWKEVKQEIENYGK